MSQPGTLSTRECATAEKYAPRAAAALLTQSRESEPTVRQRCEKPGVLVVDDEHMVRIMVQMGLEENGFDVWLAANGREAIDLYRTHREHIAVVLLEACMPGLDGPQTLNALRELNPDVLACFMSADRGAYKP